MNFHFTKLIKANNRLKEFNFRKLQSASGHLYHVDVSDERGNRIIFKVQKEDKGDWKIVEQELPKWIYEAEPQLNEALE